MQRRLASTSKKNVWPEELAAVDTLMTLQLASLPVAQPVVAKPMPVATAKHKVRGTERQQSGTSTGLRDPSLRPTAAFCQQSVASGGPFWAGSLPSLRCLQQQ